MLCVPVIIQPMVEQAFQDLLPYSELALTFDPVDLEALPSLLRDVTPGRICQLRHNAARHRRLVMWDKPGLAYEMLQLALCRRAVGVHSSSGLQSTSERSRMHLLQPWTSCARLTPEQLMAAAAPS